MNISNRLIKRILIDALGYLCLLLVILVGWLPGPGGIPLLVTGLSLLAIHNSWANRLLNYVRERSNSIRKIIFPKVLIVERLWDFAAIFILLLAFYLSISTDGPVLKVLATIFGVGSTTIFLFNRSRMESIQSKFKKP